MGSFRDSVQAYLQTEYLRRKPLISMEGVFNLRETVNKASEGYADASCMGFPRKYFMHILKGNE